MAEISTNHIDSLLAEHSNELELERQRLDELHLHHDDCSPQQNGGDDLNAENDHLSRPSTGRSTEYTGRSMKSPMDWEKQQKEELNHAISEVGENGQTPLSSRRPVRQSDQAFASDSFYSHFPSFNNQNRQREQLVSNRHQDYKDHLVQVAQKEATESRRKKTNQESYQHDHPDGVQSARSTDPISGPYLNNHISPSVCGDSHDKGNHDYNYTEISSTMNAIQDHNDEATRKKLEYQRDLRKQIDDKRRQVAELRARDKAEDEKLTKRLEQQLQSIHLEEELRKERKISEQARITHEQNHIYRMHLLAKLEQEKPHYAERMVQSENGRDQLLRESQTDDRKVYQYFRNSAPYQVERSEPPPVPQRSFQAFHTPIQEDQSAHRLDSVKETYAEYCKRCQGHMRPAVCNYCERRRHNLPINEDFCLKCSMALTTLADRQNGMCSRCRTTDLRCGYCQKHIDVCPNCNAVFCLRCHRRQNTAHGNEENERPPYQNPFQALSPRRSIVTQNSPSIKTTTNHSKISHVDSFDTESEHEIPLRMVVGRKDQKPFSTNVPHTSIFHPKAKVEEPRLAVNIRHGEVFVEDLDEKFAKYARNYNELRSKKLTPNTVAVTGESFDDDDPFPVPLMPTRKSNEQTKVSPPHVQESAAVQRLKQKWEVPAVQKNLFTTRPRTEHRVLTQLGAIRKQLQLEQMELDNTYVKYTN